VIELEEEVVRSHEWIASQRDGSPLRDPRVRVVVNDARGALQLTGARFDAIVSQPSHPWTAGASHLYTREFFALAARHLEPGGVFVQWIGLAFVDEPLLRSMVATLLEVFPHVSLFVPSQGGLLFAASDSPIDPVETARRALAATPETYARFGVQVLEDVAASWALDVEDARAFAGTAAPLTDDHNPLATRSARIDKPLGSTRLDALFSEYAPISLAGDGLDPVYVIARLVSMGAPKRAENLVQSLEDPTLRRVALGWGTIDRAPRKAAALFRQALEEDPGLADARFGLLRLLRRRVEAGDPAMLELAAPLEGTPAAVVAGWRHAAAGAWDEVRALEPALAGAGLRDLARIDALRLRIRWRTASADPALRAEGSALALELLRYSALTEDSILVAQALAAADRPTDALALVDHVSRSRRQPETQRAAIALLDQVRPGVDAEDWAEIRQRLVRRRR
jgi:hypothetical protein